MSYKGEIAKWAGFKLTESKSKTKTKCPRCRTCMHRGVGHPLEGGEPVKMRHCTACFYTVRTRTRDRNSPAAQAAQSRRLDEFMVAVLRSGGLV